MDSEYGKLIWAKYHINFWNAHFAIYKNYIGYINLCLFFTLHVKYFRETLHWQIFDYYTFQTLCALEVLVCRQISEMFCDFQ